jgi:hypothetical protein
MYIEDLISTIVESNVAVNRNDQPIVYSFYDQINSGTGFTEKQTQLALRILNRYVVAISNKEKRDISPFLENPTYRLSVRKTITNKTVNIISDTVYGKAIEVKFPYDDQFVSEIRKYRISNTVTDQTPIGINWDKEKTAWIFSLTESNIQFLNDLFSTSAFEYDEEFQKYCDDSNKILNEMENYAPMLALHDNVLTFQNSPRNLPKIETENILEALFVARRCGITLWDDYIDAYINSPEFNPITRTFLKNPLSTSINLKPENNDISCLESIVKYLGPSLFIIPGGAEYETVNRAYTMLRGMGMEDKNMSVLFRLPSETGRNFNEFVKNQSLNGPISDQTKVVFVSGKLPKTILTAGIKFNSIINFGFDNAHYTLKELAKNHPNLVYFDVKSISRGYNFVRL